VVVRTEAEGTARCGGEWRQGHAGPWVFTEGFGFYFKYIRKPLRTIKQGNDVQYQYIIDLFFL